MRLFTKMGTILETGFLSQKDHDNQIRKKVYNIIFLDENHLPTVMALQEVVVRNLASPDWLQSFSYDFMKQHMGYKGIVLGVFVENRLAGFRNLYYPDPWDKEWNLGIDLGLAETELSHVANLQLVCVHPRFRGNALAMKMNRIALGLLCKKGIHHHVCATVSPYNIWNITILLANGFYIARLKKKYGGKIRYVVYQNLRKPALFDDSSFIEVPLEDLDAQQKLLNSGYYGTALNKKKRIKHEDPCKSFDLVFKAPPSGRHVPIHWNMPDLWN